MGILQRKATDPVVIDTPDRLSSYLSSGSSSASGVVVNPTTAMQYSAWWSAVRVIAESVGMLPLHLFEEQGDLRIKVRSKLYTLLNIQPNDYMTAREFWTMCGMYLASRGNFYAWKNIINGEVVELLPLPPDTVQPRLRSDWSVVYQVHFPGGRVAMMDQDEIFHVRIMSKDGLVGVDPITALRDALGEALAGDRQAARSFKNGSRLSGILSTTGTIGDGEYERIRESWEQTYSGPENAYKVAILESGLTFQGLSMTNEQAQFLQLRQYKRAETAGILRVPPHKIGDLSRATFSNIEHQSQEFVNDCLSTYFTNIEARIRVSLVPKDKRAVMFAKFNLNALLRGDMIARSTFYTRMEQAGAMSPNEIREFEDMNPREGGDIYLTPVNMLIDGKPVSTPEPAK